MISCNIRASLRLSPVPVPLSEALTRDRRLDWCPISRLLRASTASGCRGEIDGGDTLEVLLLGRASADAPPLGRVCAASAASAASVLLLRSCLSWSRLLSLLASRSLESRLVLLLPSGLVFGVVRPPLPCSGPRPRISRRLLSRASSIILRSVSSATSSARLVLRSCRLDTSSLGSMSSPGL
jgi:hypothetical protein